MKIKYSFTIPLVSLFLIGLYIPLSAQDNWSNSECCETSCGWGRFNAGAEWLHWKVKQDNMRAGTFVDDFPDPILKEATGTMIEPKFKYNGGVRGYIGYETACSQWGINAIYTYIPLHSKSAFKKTIPFEEQTRTHRQFIIPNTPGFPLFEAFEGEGGIAALSSLSTKWHGNLSYVDIDLSRNLTFCDSFHLRPHVGFRYAWMTQHLLMQAGFILVSTNNSTFGNLKYKQKFHGYGIEGGIWADWNLGYGFSIVGHVGGSVLYSHINLKILSESFIKKKGDPVFIIRSGSKNIYAIPTIDYFAGLKYEKAFKRLSISAHVGWEQRVFLNINQIAFASGYLSLQGLTLGGDISF